MLSESLHLKNMKCQLVDLILWTKYSNTESDDITSFFSSKNFEFEALENCLCVVFQLYFIYNLIYIKLFGTTQF